MRWEAPSVLVSAFARSRRSALTLLHRAYPLLRNRRPRSSANSMFRPGRRVSVSLIRCSAVTAASLSDSSAGFQHRYARRLRMCRAPSAHTGRHRVKSRAATRHTASTRVTVLRICRVGRALARHRRSWPRVAAGACCPRGRLGRQNREHEFCNDASGLARLLCDNRYGGGEPRRTSLRRSVAASPDRGDASRGPGPGQKSH